MARGGRISKSQPVISRREFPPLNRRSVSGLVNNWQNLVLTANPQLGPGQVHGRHRENEQQPQQHVPQPDLQQVGEVGAPDQADEEPAGQVVQNAGHELHRGVHQSLAEWVNPVIPKAAGGPPREDIDGWSKIDSLSAWDCGLCQFRTLEEVPPAYRVKWTRALATILRRVLVAESEEEINRGLKWFLASAQVFFREPKRGGKKGQSNGQIALRFDCLTRGDWGSLVTQLVSDKAVQTGTGRQATRKVKQRDPATETAKLRKTVLAMLSRGQIGRAVRRICSHGVASMSDPAVREVLQSKYKQRVKDLPTSVTKGECVQSLGGLRESLLELQTGVSPGFGGLRNEHLRCFAENGEEEDFILLEAFSLKYVNGEFPPWFSKVWNSVSTVPLYRGAPGSPGQTFRHLV